MNYKALKDIIQEKHNILFTECGVFWAFSKEQLEEGKKAHPIAKNDLYVRIPFGGFMPKSNVGKLSAGLKELKAYERKMRKQIKAEEAILYELNNHEAFYAGDPMDAYEAVLKDMGYTYEQVCKVYRENYDKYADGVAIN
jgi:hypothetical protein